MYFNIKVVGTNHLMTILSCLQSKACPGVVECLSEQGRNNIQFQAGTGQSPASP